MRSVVRLVRALLCLALLQPALAAQEPITADALLARFASRLADEGPAADYAATAAELERARQQGHPRVWLQQHSSLGFDSTFSLGGNVSVDVPLLQEDVQVDIELAQARLALSEHNAAAQQRERLAAFRRSLRILAHLEEVEAILEEESAALASARQSLEGHTDPFTADQAALDPWELIRLQLLQALERSRAEKRLLALQIATAAGLPGELPARLGRPSLPATGAGEAKTQCTAPSDEELRAALVLEEERLMARQEAARNGTAINLELDAGLDYWRAADRTSGDLQWRAGLGLQVALPTSAGISPVVKLGVDERALTQSASVSWPAAGAPAADPADALERARRAYEDTLRSERFALLGALDAYAAAERELEIQRLESRQVSSVPAAMRFEPGAIAEQARVRVNVRIAELERDLALLDLHRSCDGVAEGD